ncbi:MAG: cryptochrome/photolyase family protein [Methyloceanibacter sp.]
MVAPLPIIVWFRLDLRLTDHPALAAAAETGTPLLPLYILGRWRMGGASRWWLHGSLAALDKDLGRMGGRLCLRQGSAPEVLAALLAETGASAIHATRDYAPWDEALEQAVLAVCKANGAEFRTLGGRLLFEPESILTKEGKPYRLFAPFWRVCLAAKTPRAPLRVPKRAKFVEAESERLDVWAAWGSRGARLVSFTDFHLSSYAEGRSRLDLNVTSRLSPHLHFGEVSPNQVWHAVASAASRAGAPRGAEAGAEAYLRELAWRDFSYHLLKHFPAMVSEPLRPEFTSFPWCDDAQALAAWREGRTGYPIVDAAVRELWQTGFMPNRVRMIVASFLVKHLLIPWQTLAQWFLDTLVDADLANNQANWQWVAGSGTDAAPCFRIFNPVLQGEKFDPDGAYVRRWVPELGALAAAHLHAPWQAPDLALTQAGVTLGQSYPRPIIDHATARARALAAFATLRNG